MHTLLTLSILGAMIAGCGSSPDLNASMPQFLPDSTIERIEAPYEQVAFQIVDLAKSLGWTVTAVDEEAGTIALQVPEHSDARLYFYLKRVDSAVLVTLRTVEQVEGLGESTRMYFVNLRERFHGIRPSDQGDVRNGNQEQR